MSRLASNRFDLRRLSVFLLICCALSQRSFAQEVTIEVLEPLEDGEVVFQRIGRAQIGQPEQARISIFLKVVNDTPSTVTVTEIKMLDQTVSSFAAPIEVKPGAPLYFHNCLRRGSVPLIVDAPVPESVEIEVFLEGEAAPITTSVSLRPHTNDAGPLSYVGKVSDLRPNEVWGASSNHLSGPQVFALDMGVLGWDGKAWSGVFPGADGSRNEHHRIYGMPVYAPADGIVGWALNDHEERPTVAHAETISPTLGAFGGGGNLLFIKSGREILLVAHLQTGSIPAELVVPGALVKRGQYLGKVGLSGSSSHPHVHIHMKKEPAPTPGKTWMDGCDAGPYRPMTFGNMQSISYHEATALALEDKLGADDWMQLTDHSAPHPYSLLYPTSATFTLRKGLVDAKQYIGVWREGDHIDLRVKIAGWTAFARKWDELSKDRFRLVEIDTFMENGERQHVGIFKRGAGSHSLCKVAGWDAFTKQWDELSESGLRLIDLHTYRSDGERFFLGVFRQGEGEYAVWRIAGRDAFTKGCDELGKAGLRLIDIETFAAGEGERQYIGVFQAGADAHALRSIAGWDAFAKECEALANNDLRLVDIESFREAESRRFIGAFRQGADGYALESVTGYHRFIQASERKRREGLRLVDLHVER